MEQAPDEVPQQLQAVKQLHAAFHAATCDHCGFSIMGTRFKCLSCADFDLCGPCEKRLRNKHAQWAPDAYHPVNHVFLEITRPLPAVERGDWVRLFPFAPPFGEDSVAERSSVHRGCFCIRCKCSIAGMRFVCCNCIEMYQVCEACHDRGPCDNSEAAGRHFNALNHMFIRVPFAPALPAAQFEATVTMLQHVRSGAGFTAYQMAAPSFDDSDDSDSGSGGSHDMLRVNPELFITPTSNEVLLALACAEGVVPRVVHSALPGDAAFPLLPVAWTGADALDELTVKNHLARSAELRRSQGDGPRKRNRSNADGEPMLRPFEAADMQDVMRVEHESFASPYEESAFHAMRRRPNCFLFVCEIHRARALPLAPAKVAFAGYIAFRVADEWLEIISLAVASSCRGRGVGRLLLLRALETGRAFQCGDCKLNVSVFNTAAQALYQSVGFIATKWLLGYYASDGEDALEMTLSFHYPP